jgi:O-antigen ligase
VVQCGALLMSSVLLLALRPAALSSAGVAVVGLLALASALQARDTGAALQELAQWMGLLGLALLVREAVRRGAWRDMSRALALGAAAYGAVVLTLYLLALAAHEPLAARGLFIGFDNPRFLNHVQAVSVPLLLAGAVTDTDRRWRWLAVSAAVLHVALATLALARSTGVAWLIAGALFLMLGRRRLALKFALLGLGGVGLAGLLFWLLPWWGGQAWVQAFASSSELGSAHSRDYLWLIAWKAFVGAPWLGQGPMHFAAEVNAKGAHPHNVYLQLLAEVGGPAVLLLLLGLWRLLRDASRAVRGAAVVADAQCAATASGTALCGSQEFKDNVAAERQKLQDDVKSFKYFPVINIGVTFGF